MASEQLLQQTIESFWDTVPPVWGRVRNNVRTNAIYDFNITLIQFHILRHIRHGAHTVAELAERQQISRPAVSQAVDLLVEKNLITRQQDEKDRRYVRLELTENGNNLLSTVFGKSRKWMGEKMKSLTQSEMETIIQAMDLLKNLFDNPGC